MSQAIKDFLKRNQYVRRLKPEVDKTYRLVFGNAKEATMSDPDKHAMQIFVRDQETGEVKTWITSSNSALDKIADLEKGDIFTLTKKMKKIGGKPIQVYDIEFSGKADIEELPPSSSESGPEPGE